MVKFGSVSAMTHIMYRIGKYNRIGKYPGNFAMYVNINISYMECCMLSCLSDHLIQYLSVVAEAAPNLPLFYYHIPSMTGVNCKYI